MVPHFCENTNFSKSTKQEKGIEPKKVESLYIIFTCTEHGEPISLDIAKISSKKFFESFLLPNHESSSILHC